METIEQLKELIKFQQELIKAQAAHISLLNKPTITINPGFSPQLIPGIPNYQPNPNWQSPFWYSTSDGTIGYYDPKTKQGGEL